MGLLNLEPREFQSKSSWMISKMHSSGSNAWTQDFNKTLYISIFNVQGRSSCVTSFTISRDIILVRITDLAIVFSIAILEVVIDPVGFALSMF